MRAKGGYILIKINKEIDDIVNSDFNIDVFKEIYKNNVLKPLILVTLGGCYVLSQISLGYFIWSNATYDVDDGKIIIEDCEVISISYSNELGTLSFYHSILPE